MSEKNQDGLRYPSIDELLKVIDSKYKLAYCAAKRAKIIKKEEYSSLDDLGLSKCEKPVGKALEEILEGKVIIEFADYDDNTNHDEVVIDRANQEEEIKESFEESFDE